MSPVKRTKRVVVPASLQKCIDSLDADTRNLALAHAVGTYCVRRDLAVTDWDPSEFHDALLVAVRNDLELKSRPILSVTGRKKK